MDVNREQPHLVLIGNLDGSTQLLDTRTSTVLMTHHDHTATVTSVKFLYFDHQVRYLSTSGDSYAHFYLGDAQTYSYKASSAITSSAVHPIPYLVLLSKSDGSFTFHDAS